MTCSLWLSLVFSIQPGHIDLIEQSNYPDTSLVMSIISEESAWNPDAISWAGAEGLMQVMPNTARLIATSVDARQCALPLGPAKLTHPDVSISYGTCLLLLLHSSRDSDTMTMLVDYHGGWRAVNRWKGLGINAVNKNTRVYVNRVMRRYKTCDSL
ncbi:transglycosylase SLT domain-containing protein [bacterium]|nr:transglycosylase SLT domain-containing protein [bacterium]